MHVRFDSANGKVGISAGSVGLCLNPIVWPSSWQATLRRWLSRTSLRFQ